MKRILITCLLAVTIGQVSAGEPLTLSRCRELALQHNKEKQSAALSTQAARFTTKSYRSFFFPKLSATGGALYSTMEGSLGLPGGNLPVFAPQTALGGMYAPNGSFAYFPGINLEVESDMIYSAGVQLTQPLYMGGKVRAAHRLAKTGEKMALQNERLTTAEVIESTDRAYAGVVKAKEMKQVAVAYHEVLLELERNVASAVKHGLKLTNDQMKVQVKLNESELQIRRAENALRLASLNLCHHIGLPLNDSVNIVTTYPDVPMAQHINVTDVSERPEAALLEHKVTLATEEAKLTRSDMLPKLALVGSYNYLHGVKINNRTLLNGWDFTGGVTLSVPLFNFGEHCNKMKAAKLKREQAVLERDNLNEKMVLELTQAANNLDEAQLEVLLADKALKQATENRRLSEQQYEAGVETLSDYLEAQALWQQAYERQVDSRFQLYLTHITYRKAAGTLIE